MISTREQILSQRSTKQQQMEFYETNETDVPHSTNVIPEKHTKTRTNEDVLTAELQPSLAFEKFAGKIYQDTDALARHRLVTLTSQRSQYESIPSTSSHTRYQHFESPLDRYARLKNEVQEFTADLKLITSQKIDPVMTDTATLISTNLESLSKELMSLLQDQRYSAILPTSATKTHTDLVTNLVTQLESFTTATEEKKEAKSTPSTSTSTSTSTAPVTYELYYHPEKDTVAHHQQMNLVSLDRRLAACEKYVGVNDGITLNYPDLQSGIQHLSQKLELLDQHKLEAVYRKVKGLMSELELLEQTKQQVQPNKQQIQEEKVNELYELMQRWDIAAQQLPIIVSRLQAVRDLHQESSTIMVRLQSLEQQQTQIQTLLTNDQDALQAVSTSLVQNVKIMANNVQSLEKRFQELSTKMEQLKKK